jgi:hypothetical protein
MLLLTWIAQAHAAPILPAASILQCNTDLDYRRGDSEACECLLDDNPNSDRWMGSLRSGDPYSNTCFDVPWVMSTVRTPAAHETLRRLVTEKGVRMAATRALLVGLTHLVTQYCSEQIMPLPTLELIDDGLWDLLTPSGKPIAMLDIGDRVPTHAIWIDLGGDDQPDLLIGLKDDLWTVEGPFGEGVVIVPPKEPVDPEQWK